MRFSSTSTTVDNRKLRAGTKSSFLPDKRVHDFTSSRLIKESWSLEYKPARIDIHSKGLKAAYGNKCYSLGKRDGAKTKLLLNK